MSDFGKKNYVVFIQLLAHMARGPSFAAEGKC